MAVYFLELEQKLFGDGKAAPIFTSVLANSIYPLTGFRNESISTVSQFAIFAPNMRLMCKSER